VRDTGSLPSTQRRLTAARSAWIDLAWVALWLLGLVAIVVFEHWEEIPFDLIWISFAAAYSIRVRRTKPTVWLLAAMAVSTFAAIGVDVLRHAQPTDELTAVPLMAAMFWVTMWHGRRSADASSETIRAGEERARLLASYQQFLQDASHQLKTPITIAMGHTELLARSLASRQDQRDINVIAGELNRLRRLSERLLLIAASANPDFLQPEPVRLGEFVSDVLRRWQPAADRRWQTGRLDEAEVLADAERLGLAVDALVENAVQHTSPGDVILLAVIRDEHTCSAALVVQDTGTGIPAAELSQIFDRFVSGQHTPAQRGTGLGLALVRAVCEGHGGQVRVQSHPGLGSQFEMQLPLLVSAARDTGLPAEAARTGAAGAQSRSLL
jgi:signal transduction histidine kinase